MITAEQVRELRELTGAGMMECKKVLEETEGNREKAIELLRERGVVKAAKKAGRIAAEGLVESYIHGDGRIGVLVEVNIETDFAAKNPEFREFVKDVAMQIAAANPKYVTIDEVPADIIEKEKEILRAKALNEGKPADRVEGILKGKLNKFYSEICLEEQIFIKAENKETVAEYVKNNGGTISSMIRYEVGEGIEKRKDDFASEVMSQVNGK